MAVIQALYDAADDDSATGGPDMARKIFPMVLAATEDGVQRLSNEQITDLIGQLMASRAERPDGPGAPLA
jgi:proteasome beta subunit